MERPPLLNLSRLKAASQRVVDGGGAGARSSNANNSSLMPTLFDATADELAARRAAARNEAAEVEGEASVLEALGSIHRLLHEAGALMRRGVERRKKTRQFSIELSSVEIWNCSLSVTVERDQLLRLRQRQAIEICLQKPR